METYDYTLPLLKKIYFVFLQSRTFAPVWDVFKTSTEKLASCHLDLVRRLQELIKEVHKYGDEQIKAYKKVISFFLCMSNDLLTLKWFGFDNHVIFGRLKKMFQEHWKQCKIFKVSLRPYRNQRKTTMPSVLNMNVWKRKEQHREKLIR